MKLASIEIVKEVNPHPNADRLELAKVLGWQAIIKKGEFRAGDKCVFVVIDTILPDAPWSAFLKDGDKPIRLRTVKLRGEYSQGLVLPLSVLPENVRGWQVGADVGGALGVKKYEKEIPAQLSGEVLGGFPSYIVAQTDEDNGLSNPDLVAEVLKHPLMITQKLDGSSMTVVIEDGEISHVCSRRLSLKESDKNAFWIAAKKIIIPEAYADSRWVIQGELMGPGIQGNQLGLTEPTLFVYQMKWGDDHWMTYRQMESFAAHFGLNVVSPVYAGSNSSSVPQIEDLQFLANAQKLPNGKPAEGIVVRPSTMPSSGNGRPLGFKIINQNYGE